VPSTVDVAVALCAEGVRHQERGQTDDAIRCYRAAVQGAPQMLELRLVLGMALGVAGRAAEAIDALREGIVGRTLDYALAVRFGEAFRKLGGVDAAIDCYERACALRPEAAVLGNLGGLLREAGRLEEARDVLRDAVARCATDATVLVNLGVVHHSLGEYAESVACFDAALARHPGHAGALRNRALVHLTLGDFDHGWAGHEARRAHSAERALARPAWDGSPLAGRRILLWREQGFGDQVQFVRFARIVKDLGGTVIVRCSAPLVHLLRGCDGVDEIVADGDPLPAFDVHAPLMSLPFLLGVGGNVRGEVAPYLSPTGPCPAALAAAGDTPELDVGIVWAGAPEHANDRNRSVPIDVLRPLFDVPGVTWHSLQRGSPAGALHTLPADALSRVRDPVTACGDFNDTAHVIARLDLVVTVDTAVAHVAGAMGKPVWILLPHVPDWRWLLERDDTPWYPSARLFRQQTPGGWGGVVARVRAALQQATLAARPSRGGCRRTRAAEAPCATGSATSELYGT
jgi:Flp pilus assembly protein TadD